MKRKSASKKFAAALIGGALLFSGCYTQFSTLDRSVEAKAAPQPEILVDSTGDTMKVVREKDTVTVTNNEVCYWENDLFGRPQLRCYRSFYGNDWYRYSNRPWWYDNSFYSSYYGDYYYPYNSYNYPFSHDYWYYNDYYRHRNYRDDDYSSGGGRQAPAPTRVQGGRAGSGSPMQGIPGGLPSESRPILTDDNRVYSPPAHINKSDATVVPAGSSSQRPVVTQPRATQPAQQRPIMAPRSSGNSSNNDRPAQQQPIVAPHSTTNSNNDRPATQQQPQQRVQRRR
jgi:hypothetical protein